MKEIVSKILEVTMCLIPFFGKGKRERVVRGEIGRAHV